MLHKLLILALCSSLCDAATKKHWKIKKNGEPVTRKQRSSKLLKKFGKQEVRGITEERSAEDDIPTSLGEVMIHVHEWWNPNWLIGCSSEDTLEIELPSGATVRDLYAATGGGINNLLSFKGTVLADRSAPLAEVGISEVGSSTEAVVDSTKIASFAWGKDDLDKMKPIFEAEIRCACYPYHDQAHVEKVFMQWYSDSTILRVPCAWYDNFTTIAVMQTETGQWIRVPRSPEDSDLIFRRLWRMDMCLLDDREANTNTVPGRVRDFPVSFPKRVWYDPGTAVGMTIKRVVYWDGTDAPWDAR